MSGGAWVAAVPTSPAVSLAVFLVVFLAVFLAVSVMLLPLRRARAGAWGTTRPVLPVRVTTSHRQVDIGLLLTEVASLLRAGASPARAWSRALGRCGVVEGIDPGEDGVPPALADLGVPTATLTWPRWEQGRLCWQLPARGTARRRLQAAAAAVPGAAAACRLSASLGAPLAEVLDAVASGVAESGRAEASRVSALTGPRTTARLLACLPLVGLGLGAVVGADPVSFLLDGGWGSVLGATGAALMVAGHQITRGMVRAATASARGTDEALVLDLASASLAAGASLPGVLVALGEAVEEEAFCVVGRALLLGAGWEEAWDAPGDPVWRSRYASLEGCLRPGWEDGASPQTLLAATAATVRVGRRARDEEAAERLAVRLVVPLGACHLPAFVLLGLVPVIASVGAGLLAS
ncbi:type II secretion system F family protein [Actinomyces wuliandei]|uniref:type II secretion system F family protein n=1 Tax=Actinomyces wuliandei TaxID=2057743 RepID=UPI00214B05C3|nr:hypothetical protein [Actinomyces wuliandei]